MDAAREIFVWLAAGRHAWLAAPIVIVVFTVLQPVPVTVLIGATGVAFGPILGPVYAMLGCIASATAGFALGRWIGAERVARTFGRRAARANAVLERNGVLAVFLLRKVPLHFAVANVVMGATTVPFRDFLIGTILGMGAFVIGLAAFGTEAMRLLANPTPAAFAVAVLAVAIPLAAAFVVNHVMKKRMPAC